MVVRRRHQRILKSPKHQRILRSGSPRLISEHNVRDAAKAHIAALKRPEAEGEGYRERWVGWDKKLVSTGWIPF